MGRSKFSKKNLKDLKPKPVIVLEIEDVVNFTKSIGSEFDPNFIEQITQGRIKLSANSLCVKREIAKFLKEDKFQFYVITDIEVPPKVALKGLPKSMQTENI